MQILRNIKILSSDGRAMLLDVYYDQDHKAKRVVIFSHGHKSFKDWGTFDMIAKSFAEKGFIFIKFNFSHNGTTVAKPDEIVDLKAFGNSTIESELNDIQTVIEWVGNNKKIDEQEINKKEIYLMGHSRGGSLSILAASENKMVKKVATWAAFNDFEKIWKFYNLTEWKKEGVWYSDYKGGTVKLPLNYKHYENYEANRERFDILKAIKHLKIPLLAVHGTEDDVIGFEQAIEMKSVNAKVDLGLMPNADHSLGGYHPYEKIRLPFDTRIAMEDTIKFFKGVKK